MIRFIAAALLSFAVPSFANELIHPEDAPQHTVQVRTQFDRAQMPSEAELAGWYSGRCHHTLADSNLEGALLQIRRTGRKPLAPAVSLSITFTPYWINRPDFYDRMDERARGFLRSFPDSGTQTSVRSVDGSLGSMYYASGDGDWVFENRIRKVGPGHFVTQTVVVRNAWGLAPGTVSHYCDFYRRVR
ncbi:MAG: hypothetical protein HY078_17520 [Elusimicrobia bacterium]|nr:hypothetical protein [Elusimicrobiota bacterium]